MFYFIRYELSPFSLRLIFDCTSRLEHAENLGTGTRLGHRLVRDNVETNGLGERSKKNNKDSGEKTNRCRKKRVWLE
jgi:hypothetical protein